MKPNQKSRRDFFGGGGAPATKRPRPAQGARGGAASWGITKFESLQRITVLENDSCFLKFQHFLGPKFIFQKSFEILDILQKFLNMLEKLFENFKFTIFRELL